VKNSNWGKVFNDEVAAIAGKQEEPVGRLQAMCGITTSKANGQNVTM